MTTSFDGDALLSAAERAAETPAAAAEESFDVLTFWVAGELYGLRLSEVSEVAKLPAITPVPGLPDVLLGAVNLRGEVLAVADLATLLGLGAARMGPDARLVMVNAGGERAGLLVDRIGDLVAAVPASRGGGADIVALQALLPDGSLVALLSVDRVVEALSRGA